MTRWQQFLDSLASKGGNLFVLSLFVSSLLLLVMHVRNEPNGQALTVILSTFSGFSGALLSALTGSIGGVRKGDANGQLGTNGATVTGTSTTSTQSTATTTK